MDIGNRVQANVILFLQNFFLQHTDTGIGLSKVIQLLMDIKMTVETMDTRLQHLEAASIAQAKQKVSVRKVTDQKSLVTFLTDVHGREEEYVSRTLYYYVVRLRLWICLISNLSINGSNSRISLLVILTILTIFWVLTLLIQNTEVHV